MRIKIITHPNDTSFHRIALDWMKLLRKMTDYVVVDDINIPSDITILYPSFDILETFKFNKEKDGKIICVDTSETDRVSTRMADLLNSECDEIVTHTNWSKQGMMNGGVTKDINVIPLGIDYRKTSHADKIGFYITFITEHIIRKGTDLALEVMKNLPSHKVLVKQYHTDFKLPWESVGWVEDIYKDFYSRINTLIHLPRGGGQELEVYEALASGCRVIVPDHPLFDGLPVIRAKSRYIKKVILSYPLSLYHVGGGYEADVIDVLDKINKIHEYPLPNFNPPTKKDFLEHLISIF